VKPSASQLYAELYDLSVPDWPGEMEFYRRLAAQATAAGLPVLEIACGTGRIAVRLAQDGARLVGVDHSADMLEIARRKSAGMPNLRWIEGDMRSFKLDETFGLAIIPGHSFQYMLTPQDQLACLARIRRHLTPGALLVMHLDHQDFTWLGGLSRSEDGPFVLESEIAHPLTGRLIRTYRRWSYHRLTQTASTRTFREEISETGQVLQRWDSETVHLHCAFRFEIEHLLVRAGYRVQSVYGDFLRSDLSETSSEMVWLAERPC
jgi:ubiquinone/menaquinone biosynthesis C-methylase UbiE